MTEIRSFADLHARIDAWDGTTPPAAAWHAALEGLRQRCQTSVWTAAKRAQATRAEMVAHQQGAARLRLVEELGRFLVCYQPDTPDLNGKLYRLANDRTATAARLRQVLDRLSGYPEWPEWHIAELRNFRDSLLNSQIKARMTGRELEAALADPRWQVTFHCG